MGCRLPEHSSNTLVRDLLLFVQRWTGSHVKFESRLKALEDLGDGTRVQIYDEKGTYP